MNGGEFFVHIGDGDVHLAHGAAEAREVAVEGEELAVVDVRDLVDAVAELIAAVLDVDLRLARCIEMIVEKAKFPQKNGLLDDVRMNFCIVSGNAPFIITETDAKNNLGDAPSWIFSI